MGYSVARFAHRGCADLLAEPCLLSLQPIPTPPQAPMRPPGKTTRRCRTVSHAATQRSSASRSAAVYCNHRRLPIWSVPTSDRIRQHGLLLDNSLRDTTRTQPRFKHRHHLLGLPAPQPTTSRCRACWRQPRASPAALVLLLARDTCSMNSIDQRNIVTIENHPFNEQTRQPAQHITSPAQVNHALRFDRISNANSVSCYIHRELST
jgi:hypothetical protein